MWGRQEAQLGIKQTQPYPPLAYFMTALSPSSPLKLREKEPPPNGGCLGLAGTHLFLASVALCLLQMRAEIRGHVQPRQGTEKETKVSRNQKDNLTPELVLLLPAASYSGVQSVSLRSEEQNWMIETGERVPPHRQIRALGVRSHCGGAEGIVDSKRRDAEST